jgi:uncharacterized protein Usg
MGSSNFEGQLRGLRLTTAEITYRMPDFRDIMQIYIWQDYDPAIASGTFVTTVTDVVGFFAFLGLAAVWLL